MLTGFTRKSNWVSKKKLICDMSKQFQEALPGSEDLHASPQGYVGLLQSFMPLSFSLDHGFPCSLAPSLSSPVCFTPAAARLSPGIVWWPSLHCSGPLHLFTHILCFWLRAGPWSWFWSELERLSQPHCSEEERVQTIPPEWKTQGAGERCSPAWRL